MARRALHRVLSAGLVLLLATPAADAQERDAGAGADAQGRLAVVVEYVAGANLYVGVGSDAGLTAGDTLAVYDGRTGAYLGTLRVVSSVPGRSVLTFAGAAFAVTRGETLELGAAGARAAAPAGEARAILLQQGGSGVSATLSFIDDGAALRVRGWASGLDPGGSYVSWMYDRRSSASGPAACTPGGSREPVKLGGWAVDSAGRGTFSVTLSGQAYAPLDEFAAVAIRDGSQGFVLVACGAVDVSAPAGGVERTAARRSTPPVGRRTARAGRGGSAARAAGRLSFDVDALRSTTYWGTPGQEPIERTFTTPAVRLRMRVTGLPGGVQFSTNLRAATRYSSEDLVQPERSVSVYEASLSKDVGHVLRLQAGRFYNPYERFSGYWDGALMRLGGRGFGAGVAYGFQPDRAVERFSTDRPKYTVFLDFQSTGVSAAYYADLSFHRVQAGDTLFGRTFVGFSQRLRLGGFRLSQRVQADREPAGGRWTLTHLQTAATLPLTPGVSLYGRYVVQRLFTAIDPGAPFSSRRERGTAGLLFSLGGGTLSADVTRNRLEERAESYTFASSLNFPRTGLAGLGFSLSGSYWMEGPSRTVLVAPGLQRRFGNVLWQLFYRRYSAENASGRVLTNGLELFLDVPLARRWHSTIQARIQRGTNLDSNGLYWSLWTAF